MSGLKGRLFESITLSVKRFNDKHKILTPVTTFFALLLIVVLSIIFQIIEIIRSIFTKKRAVGVLLALLLLGAVIAIKVYNPAAKGQNVETSQAQPVDTAKIEEQKPAETQAAEEQKVAEAEPKSEETQPAKEQQPTESEQKSEETKPEETEQKPEEVKSAETEQKPEEAKTAETEQTKADTESSESEPSATNEPATEAAETVIAINNADSEFDKLIEEYPETVGWIYFEDGHISYPIMQSSDNQKYSHTGYTGDESWAGSIFLDYRSASDFSDPNSIVYGHNMKDGSMFGSLREYRKDPGYYKDHKYFLIITPDKVNKYLIFAYMDVPDNYVLYDYVGNAGNEFLKDAEPVRRKSYMDSEIPVNNTKKVVTLSTCTAKDDLQFVVCGVLVEEADR